MKLPTYFFAICISVYSVGAMADCSFVAGHRTEILNFVIPSTLSIPRDTANGTVLFESPPISIINTPNSIICSPPYNYGITNSAGNVTPQLNALPIGNTGIGWKLTRKTDNRTVPLYPSTGEANATIGFGGTSFGISLIKIGEISGDAKLAPSIIGYFQYGSVAPIGVQVTGTSFVAQSCETPDVKVDMGEHDISTFIKNGWWSNSVKFNISLKNCPSGINKVQYRLTTTPSSPAQNSRRGIVKLGPESTATGLRLQILDAEGNEFLFYENYTFTDYSSVGGNFSIPLSARYFRVVPTQGNGGFDKGMRAGTANASVIFMMSYL